MDTDDYDTCMTGIGDLSCDNLPESGGDMGGGNNISGRLVLTDLPEEVQQIVLDMLAGNLRSTSSTATDHYGTRNWSNALRHPRAKELSNLTLVTPAWRRMIQERLYRHGQSISSLISLEYS